MIEALQRLADAQEAVKSAQGEINAEAYKHNPQEENALETLKNDDIAGVFSNAIKNQLEAEQKEAQAKAEKKEQAKQERKEQQENRKKQARDATASSATLKAEILKGLQQGRDIYELFILAVECIGKATGDTVIREQAEQDIKTIYGRALGHPGALQTELNDVENRLETMRKNLNNPGLDQARVRIAIKRHEELAQDLRRQIKGSD